MPGLRGEKGNPGLFGRRGRNGFPGEKGIPGVLGKRGKRGGDGQPGFPGVKGKVGEPGPPNVQLKGFPGFPGKLEYWPGRSYLTHRHVHTPTINRQQAHYVAFIVVCILKC